MASETDRAQAWLEQMADVWLTQPEITPTFPPGLVIKGCGWRVVITPDPAPLTAATAYERIKTAEEVEFFATLADGREVTTRRPASLMKRAAVPSWQQRERVCCCGRPENHSAPAGAVQEDGEHGTDH